MRGINWSDEPYVRSYRYDHPDWIDLSWQAKGIYLQLRRKADRAGLLPLGMAGVSSLAGQMGHGSEWADITPFVEELIKFKWLELHGSFVIIPDFIESESAQASPAQRTRQSREKRRDMAKLPGHPSVRGDAASVIPKTVTSSRASVTSTREPVTNTDDHVTSSVTSIVTSSVTSNHGARNAARNKTAQNDECSMPITFTSSLPDQIPPIPPRGNGGDNGGGPDPIHGDPNLEDIRRKLLGMGKPLCYLPAVRAEERLYAAVLSGGMTTQHVLQAIDDAAVSLGPDLGAIQADDKPGLASLERFVAGCVKRARRDRYVANAPVPTPRVQALGTAHPYEPGPEALDALDRFRESYTSTGGYDRYVVGPDDARLAGEAHVEAEKHGDPQDILVRAMDTYMRDEFYAAQGHNLKRFVAVLKSEPARLLGRRRAVESEEDKLAKWKNEQVLKDLREQMSS